MEYDITDRGKEIQLDIVTYDLNGSEIRMPCTSRNLDATDGMNRVIVVRNPLEKGVESGGKNEWICF